MKYKAAIIGLGFIGGADQVSGDALGQKISGLDGTHYDAYNNNKKINLIAGSSRDYGRRYRFGKKTNAKIYENWKDLIKSEQLDIVSIATYTPSHEEITIACSEVGIKVVFCEKPAAHNLRACKNMIDTCKKNDTLLVFNHQRRFNQNYIHLKNLITQGELGELTSINAQWGSGRLGNVGTHVLDAIYMLTSLLPKSVIGKLDTTGKPDCRGKNFYDPGCWGCIELNNNLMITVDAADNNVTPIEIKINGTKGRAITGGSDVSINYWDDLDSFIPRTGKTVKLDCNNKRSSMDLAVDEMINYLENGNIFSYQALDAFKVTESIIAFYVSNNENSEKINLPLDKKYYDLNLNSG